ncbi:efflux RND transporter periplasmic adaptor subunit [Paracoccus sp. Z118]|uniref:efflux RND transporter periplasmic adaptor subunit n=1 Tax=Paracoccus sp. Z118 TaxID=2851017 RepID=UPI001C2C9CD5|nr:efflux RND transporter periplasmic adaptor subunit [Paracoccus sp. Z118]MBV0891490.1 efflux RND transporter periplasmic adaptor subunit [Paracoccus sp. Z118]
MILRPLLLALALCAALPAPLAALSLREETAPPPAPPRPVVSEIVTDLPAIQRSVPGVIAAETETVLAFETLGTMSDLLVDMGDQVSAGQVLARMNPEDLQADMRAAGAALASANVRLDTARATAERTRALSSRDVTSQAQLEQAEQALAAAEAARRQADSQLARAVDALGFTSMTAPFGGLVSAIHRNEGSVVSAGEPVLTLASQHAREAVIDLTEAQLAGLSPGDPFTVMAEVAPDRPFAARVDRIEPLADAATRTRRVHLALDDGDGLRIGTLIRVSRSSDGGPVLTVPPSALVRAANGPEAQVWVVAREAPDRGTVSLRGVTTGPEVAGRIRITRGLAAGDEVVIRGVHSLRDGMSVGRAVSP